MKTINNNNNNNMNMNNHMNNFQVTCRFRPINNIEYQIKNGYEWLIYNYYFIILI